MSKASKMVVDRLIADLKERPLDFVCDEFTLKDKGKGLEYSIAYEVFRCRMCSPYLMEFGFIQSYRFHSALDEWKAWFNLNRKVK